MALPKSNEYVDITGTGITLVETSKGDTFLIDTDERAKVERHGWTRHRSGYIVAAKRVNGKNRTIYLHRLICATNGNSPHVDHANGDKADCRSANLRKCSRAKNLQNQKINARNATGVKGVFQDKKTGKYVVRIAADGVRHYFGYFSEFTEASKIASAKREQLHGEFARHG